MTSLPLPAELAGNCSDGVILLKFHHARFYLERMKKAVGAADLRGMGYSAPVLVAGAVYHLTGRQPRNRLIGAESFQSEGLLRRELSRHGLVIRNVMAGSTPQTPSVVLVKGFPTHR